MQVKSIAECFKGSILQYFRPSLSYIFQLRPLFCIFLRGRLRQVLLYMDIYGTYCIMRMLLLPYMNNKGAVQPVHKRSLISTIDGH